MNRRNLIELLIAAPLAALGIKALPRATGWPEKYPMCSVAGSSTQGMVYAGPAAEDIHPGDVVSWSTDGYRRPGNLYLSEDVLRIAVNRAKIGEKVHVASPYQW